MGCGVADLAWSDGPNCTPGYVASADGDYVRFTHLKEAGSPFGGRVYFVDAASLNATCDIARRERQPALVTQPDRPRSPWRSSGNPGAVRVK